MTQLALIQLLIADADISAIIGDKVSLDYIPQNQTPPLLLLNVEDNGRGITKDDLRIEDLDIDIISVAATAADALSLDAKVFALMQYYKAATPTVLSTGESISINHVYQQTTRSEYSNEIKWHTVTSTYRVLSNITN